MPAVVTVMRRLIEMSSIELPDQTKMDLNMMPGRAAQLADKLMNRTRVCCEQ